MVALMRYLRTRRDEIYEFVVMFADDHSGATLTPHGIWMEMKRRDLLQMKWSTFRSHWLQLLIERRIEVKDGVVVVVGSEWHPPEPEKFLPSFRLPSQDW